jgi:hypothetical protein
MTNAARRAPLPTINDTVDGTHIVTSSAARTAIRNSPQLHDIDLAVLVVAKRFGLAPHVSRLIVELAGLGCDDRTTASGGRTK